VTDEIKKKRTLPPIVDALVGALLAAIASAGISMIALGHRWEASVPLAFIAILLVISGFFGARAGILGTLIAAFIFATFLFHYPGGPQAGSDAARANLAWMLLLGISLSFLFAPPSGYRRH
jgi:hypothetical protein